MAHASVGGFQYIGTYSAGNSYGSWPWATRDNEGNTHLAYRDWDGTTAGAHATGGAFWYSKNGATPAKKFDATSESSQIQDAWVLQQPAGDRRIVLIERLSNTVGPDYRHRYSVSTNLGATFPAMTNMTLPTGTGWTSASVWAFSDFALSDDGTKYLGAAYDESGNCYLLESADLITWAKRSTIGTTPGVEPGLVRFPDGRLLCLIRNATNTLPGLTSISDDDGATWTTPATPNATAATVVGNNFCIAAPPRGLAVSDQEAVILGRYLDGTGYIWHAQWTMDRNGGYASGPTRLSNTNAAAGGYFCFNEEPGGRFVYGYTDVGTNGGDARIFRAALKLSI